MSSMDSNEVDLTGLGAVCLDDEETITEVTGFILELAGMNVITDTDPTRGIQRAVEARNQGQTIDVVIMDGRGPDRVPYGYTRQCLAALGEVGMLGEVAKVLASGDLRDGELPEDVAKHIDRMLPKPYKNDQFLNAVKAALAIKRAERGSTPQGQ